MYSGVQLVLLCYAEDAIIIAKTDILQTMFAFGCSNPHWGCMPNLWDAKYTCRKSMGGDVSPTNHLCN
ncbi:hypothetical protein EDD16DRAFT_1495610 [Pisolithus croceorrhizus]|nr:hypothetical protein EDD16DRAFT_1495610 [Pisolithus croceorrhizus]KAI6108496.1 hypothetical protein EV401DRAFT_1871196 [Pisolithus croceorrhizus]KAI6156186.1 hypothetical protein EDD17DRAFT_1489731 [Pisolithus thermaeus]